MTNTNIIIHNLISFVHKNHQGSSLLLPALGWVGRGRLKNIMPVRQKNLRAKPKQAGKKEGGLGEGIFARLPRLGVGKRFRNSCVSRKAKQKNFRFLNPVK